MCLVIFLGVVGAVAADGQMKVGDEIVAIAPAEGDPISITGNPLVPSHRCYAAPLVQRFGRKFNMRQLLRMLSR